MENDKLRHQDLQEDQQAKDENLFTRDNSDDFSSGPLTPVSDDEDDEDLDERLTSADDDEA